MQPILSVWGKRLMYNMLFDAEMFQAALLEGIAVKQAVLLVHDIEVRRMENAGAEGLKQAGEVANEAQRVVEDRPIRQGHLRYVCAYDDRKRQTIFSLLTVSHCMPAEQRYLHLLTLDASLLPAV